jgi:hypothetical protein
VVFVSGVVAAQEKKTGIFRDSIDGAIDLSQWLFELHGFLPIINVITEPAVGYGGTAVGVYFISKEKSSEKEFRMPIWLTPVQDTPRTGAGSPVQLILDSGRMTGSDTAECLATPI